MRVKKRKKERKIQVESQVQRQRNRNNKHLGERQLEKTYLADTNSNLGEQGWQGQCDGEWVGSDREKAVSAERR